MNIECHRYFPRFDWKFAFQIEKTSSMNAISWHSAKFEKKFISNTFDIFKLFANISELINWRNVGKNKIRNLSRVWLFGKQGSFLVIVNTFLEETRDLIYNRHTELHLHLFWPRRKTKQNGTIEMILMFEAHVHRKIVSYYKHWRSLLSHSLVFYFVNESDSFNGTNLLWIWIWIWCN